MTRALTLHLIAGRLGLITLFAALPSACAPPPSQSSARLTAPLLGSAQSFAVLAGSTVTNTGPTSIAGNLGVDPGLAVTGFPPGLVTGGTIHAGDAVALQAQSDVTTAYNALAGEVCNVDESGKDLGGLTLTQGVYCFSSSAQLTGKLTLDAEGDPGAVFIFQIGSTLTTASNSSVVVINGGVDCNVFWQVGSSAVLGTTTVFVGDVLALASVTLTTGAGVSGRALARTGAVTMDTNVIAMASCAGAPDAGVADGAARDAARPGDLATTVIPDAAPARDAAATAPDAAVPADLSVCDAAVPADLSVCDAAQTADLAAVRCDAALAVDLSCSSH
jgi:Ice-binding-like